jgi:predicted ATPase
MRLVNFSVTNFRSITVAHKVPISDTTVLIGRNNEGKSNVLKALSFAMAALLEHAARERRGGLIRRAMGRRDDGNYSWERDFPIALQTKKGSRQSIFRLEFELSYDKVGEFKKEIKSDLNGTLPLEIRIGEDNKPIIKVSKKGRGSKTLNSKSGKIADFIGHRIFFNYIPAIRTDREAHSVISDMLAQELRVLESDEAYQNALKTIADLQKPVLEKLAKRIKEPLNEFLPNIKKVRIDVVDDLRRTSFRRDFEVVVDDGTATNLEFKGDGVKSLAALGLLKHRDVQVGASIIAIEEPESHLHPAAIHQLNDIISALSVKNQVIVTTHNPLFVDRLNMKANVIIESGKATPARNVRQIRDLLGIKASDNLINANYTLVVEGEEDKTALHPVLSSLSAKIAKAVKSNLLVIETMAGAGNLPYKLSLMKQALCIYHVLLDNDDAGRNSFENAKQAGLVSLKNCTLTNCLGMPNSELEDCIDPGVYQADILTKYGVDLTRTQFRGNRKWSERMKNVFMDQGKAWNDSVEKEIKAFVADRVADNPRNALHPQKRNSIDALVTALESVVQV